jgi:hypothetical protein
MSSHNSFIRRLNQLNRALPNFSNELSLILREETIRDHTSGLSAEDALWLVDYLDNVRVLLPNS